MFFICPPRYAALHAPLSRLLIIIPALPIFLEVDNVVGKLIRSPDPLTIVTSHNSMRDLRICSPRSAIPLAKHQFFLPPHNACSTATIHHRLNPCIKSGRAWLISRIGFVSQLSSRSLATCFMLHTTDHSIL